MTTKRETFEFRTLVNQYNKQELIPYSKLLNTIEWAEKRNEILKRDKHACVRCKRNKTGSFSRNQIQAILDTNNDKIIWRIVGSDLQVIDSINGGDYWFFSIKTLDKFRSSYWELKFAECKKGDTIFVLIQAPKRYFLQIHHKHYILNKLPWEYRDSDLQTVCNWCHWDIHCNEKVNTFMLIDGVLIKTSLTPCYKCKGAGWFPEYVHIESGICFRCLGQKFEELIFSQIRE